MPAYTTLDPDQLSTLEQMLAARPFTEDERDYWQLCWLPMSHQLVDDANALMPSGHVIAPRELGGTLYVNVDLLSDAFPDSPTPRLAALFDLVKAIEFVYIDPWQWETVEPAPDWTPWDGHNESLYQVGDKATHSGSTWISSTPNNHWEPGVFGWKEESVGGVAPSWRQPLGAGDTYSLDDEVSWHGGLYKSTIDNNSWAPNVTGWVALNPEPPSNEWAAGVAYSIGDEVVYLGTTYRCIQAHTAIVSWEPPNVPALWQIA
jgi:hypothetical protein